MKPGDLVRNKQIGTTTLYNLGLILEIYPNGKVKNPETLARVLWNQGHQTSEFLKDFEIYYEVLR